MAEHEVDLFGFRCLLQKGGRNKLEWLNGVIYLPDSAIIHASTVQSKQLATQRHERLGPPKSQAAALW